MSKDKKNNASDLEVLNLEEALKKVIELSKSSGKKILQSVDIAVNLGIDPKQSDQMVKGSLVLPNGSGKKIRVVVFAANDEIKKIALDAGAVFAGLEDLVTKIEGGFLDFDCCVATPDVMSKISKVAKKLGPRGLMPSPRNGTVTTDIKKAIEDALKGRVDFKNDKAGTLHCLVGKVDFDFDKLLANLKAVIRAIKDSKPEASKGKFIKDFYINSTMGPAVKVSTQSL
ncbi:MAG: large subunit ribosomal protein L1 [Rickettsiales bacterium]|jgi:large subunit ribosomal protein L1